jgi:hypothetical protein
MSLTDNTLNSLRKLVENNPSLLAQLHQSDDVAQSARLLAQAASAANIAVTEEALRAHLEISIQQATQQALNDDQLDKVAGGMSKEGFIAFFALSVTTFGITCAAISIGSAIAKGVGYRDAASDCWS